MGAIATTNFTRNTFPVEAVRLTKDNLSEVVEWCDGELRETENNRKHLKLKYKRNGTHLPARLFNGYVGDWVVRSGNSFKIYTNKSFNNTFTKDEVTQ